MKKKKSKKSKKAKAKFVSDILIRGEVLVDYSDTGGIAGGPLLVDGKTGKPILEKGKTHIKKKKKIARARFYLT